MRPKKSNTMDIGLYCRVDSATMTDLTAIQRSHHFDSIAQAVRWAIRSTASAEKLRKEVDLIDKTD